MRLTYAVVLAWVLGGAFGCGSKQSRPQALPESSDAGTSSGSSGSSASAAPTRPQEVDAGIKAPAAPLTEAECDDFVDHVVAVAASLRSKNTRGEPADTADSIAATKAKLRSELRGECLKVSRSLFECAMKAQDAPALAACQGAYTEGAPPT